MQSIQQQFKYHELPGHFEPDTHIDIQDTKIERIHLLTGETAAEDIIAVIYSDSPNMSFYDAYGRGIDVDHYLPDQYRKIDTDGADQILINLKQLDKKRAKTKSEFHGFLTDTIKSGEGNMAIGLRKKYGLETTKPIFSRFLHHLKIEETIIEMVDRLPNRYESFFDFLEDLIIFQQKWYSGYVHITYRDNIVITPLNKRSGVAIMIETQSPGGHLLPPDQWIITRTDTPIGFEQALVFRSPDIQAFFETSGMDHDFETDRYRLYHTPEEIAIDSLVDNTNNKLLLPLVNDCYHVLPADPYIIIVLSSPRTVHVVNTHRSVVPHKWPRKIDLPQEAAWVRMDENLTILYLQSENGDLFAYNVTEERIEEIAHLGNFGIGFELDQSGNLLVKNKLGTQLLKLVTNSNDIEVPSDQKNLSMVLKNLSELFKGDRLFSKTQFAKVITEVAVPEEKKLPSVYEKARFDFETNIEHKLVEAGNDFEALLAIQNQIAIARRNIGEELTLYAEREGIVLIGQRLKNIVNNIIRPSERMIRNLVEEARSQTILSEVSAYQAQIATLEDPGAYREILNNLHLYEQELHGMYPGNTENVMGQFKAIQQELNLAFSKQISSDGTALQNFINAEIAEIENAIEQTYDHRQLEILLATHPAALELMNLLKQPFVLQNVVEERKLSPAAIQNRLYQKVVKRKAQIDQELEHKRQKELAAKQQMVKMIEDSIDFFVKNHSGSFADVELSGNATYQQLLNDIHRLESELKDVRLSLDMRRKLERRMLERNREDLEKMVAFEGKYAYVQNDPDLFVDLESTNTRFPLWSVKLVEKRGVEDAYNIIFERDIDKEVYRPDTTENLKAGKAFEINAADYPDFSTHLEFYLQGIYGYKMLDAVWDIFKENEKKSAFPQFDPAVLDDLIPESNDKIRAKALRCVLEKKKRDFQERNRKRQVPVIPPEFIDETPYFQKKLQEFMIKSKLQMVSGAGIILLSGPPSTGKSAFLKFVASLTNREYFEHAADKWQTKNSLVTAIRFGEAGPYTTPAGFTRAITTPHSLVNIEEIKEWPEALRKSLNPFFAGSKIFTAADGTQYHIGENILLCAAANLGAMYRQDDEPFTADFWSRIEVVEYEYAPQVVDRTYYNQLHEQRTHQYLTMQDLVRGYFNASFAPEKPEARARYYAQQFLEFILLPKADETIKRTNLQKSIRGYFQSLSSGVGTVANPEEAAKVALRRLKDLQGYSVLEFFDWYDHFVNQRPLRSKKLSALQSADIERYIQLKIQFLIIYYLEGALRLLREQFYTTAGQTEIEGTNREFIKGVYLLGLLGRV